MADDARSFLFAELSASEEHSGNKAFGWDHPYFGKKYQGWDRFLGARDWVKLKLVGLVWGHGERPLRVLCLSSFVIWFFAALYGFGVIEIVGADNVHLPLVGSLGFSASAFTTTT